MRATAEGALVSLDAATGDMLALVGGADFNRNVFDHALQAYRQPGSSFKPFVYSAALERATSRACSSTIRSARSRMRKPARVHGARAISPTTTRASFRCGAAHALEEPGGGQPDAGYRRALRAAARGALGFDAQRNPASLPLALGAGAVTPLELASAYSVFANGGTRMEPRLILSVKQRHGGAIYEATAPSGERVVSARNAFVMDSMLRDVVKSGTARARAAPRRRGRQDGHVERLEGRVVRRLLVGHRRRCVARLRHAAPDGARPVRRWRCRSGSTMKTAVDGRTPVEATPPQDVALVDGDFVYAEYTRAARPTCRRTSAAASRAAGGGGGRCVRRAGQQRQACRADACRGRCGRARTRARSVPDG